MTLTAPGFRTATHLGDLRQLRAEVEALGGEFPAALAGLMDAIDLINSRAQRPVDKDLARPLLDAAVAGELDDAKFASIVRAAATAQAEAQAGRDLARAAYGDLIPTAGSVLANGGGDFILDTLRPTFDEDAQTITRARQLVSLDQDAARFIEEADPEALTAYQAIKPAAQRIGRIIAVAAQFGHSRKAPFPLIADPTIGGSVPFEDLEQMPDDSLFLAHPEHGAGGLMSMMQVRNNYDQAMASQRTIRPQSLGMRAGLGPYVNADMRLNTVSEAREIMRAWSEAKFDNTVSTDYLQTLGNPYRVEVSPLDDDERFPYGKPAEAS